MNCSVLDYDNSKPHEECGVFGIYSSSDEVNPAYMAYNGLLPCNTEGRKAAASR